MFPGLNTSNGLSGVSAMLREKAENPLRAWFLWHYSPFIAHHVSARFVDECEPFDRQTLIWSILCSQHSNCQAERRTGKGPCSHSQKYMLNGAFDAVLPL